MDGHCAPEAERLATWGCSLSTGKRLHRSAVCTPGHTSLATGATVHRRSPGRGRSQWTASRKARAIAAGSVARRTAVCAATPLQCESADRRWGVMPPRAKHGTGAASARRRNPSTPSIGRPSPGFDPGGCTGERRTASAPSASASSSGECTAALNPPVQRKVRADLPGTGRVDRQVQVRVDEEGHVEAAVHRQLGPRVAGDGGEPAGAFEEAAHRRPGVTVLDADLRPERGHRLQRRPVGRPRAASSR